MVKITYQYTDYPGAGSIPATISSITHKLIMKLIERDRIGFAKYGTSLDRTDLTENQWLDHMTEELLDAAGYAQAAKQSK